jgi:threonine/homoserine/homoserine lactone efflux protein
MIGASNFLFAFVFSFIGSIPPGTINLAVIQLGFENRLKTAMRFAAAAALMEYPYAWIAVTFEKMITSQPVIIQNIEIIGSSIMIVIGIINLWPASKNPSGYSVKFAKSGFRRGLVLGILNPLAIPYWIALTAYLRAQGWVIISSTYTLHAYLTGVVIGAFLILFVFAHLGKRAVSIYTRNPWIQKAPGITLIGLGLYGFIQVLFA